MTTTPKISVIVPVYKVEKYLCKCIDSILAQTFTDFELLLIDDGSPDKSGEICDEYAEKDFRIRVFHKKNGGVSSARNLGLEKAKGEWISFVDADDWVSENYLEQDLKTKANIIQLGYDIVSENGELTQKCAIMNNELTDKCQIFRFFVQKRNNALWDKLFSRDLISEQRFDENVSVGEDFLFMLSLICKVQRYGFSSRGKYFYVIRNSSAMGNVSKSPRKRLDIVIQNIVNVCNTIPHEQNLRNGILFSTYLNFVLSNYKLLTEEEKLYITNLFSSIKFSTLEYVSTKEKFRIYAKWLIYKLVY